MQKIIAIIVCWCCFLQASAQSNIVNLEYFVDTDPGFGNGTSVSITPATNISNIVFNVPLGSFTPGLHTLYTRSKDANGKWSITNSKLFYKSGTTSSPVNITRLEYFFDTDPGVGNGTNIPITPGVNLQNINYSADISVLTIGIHYLFVRSKDANGKWSITNKIIFYKAGSTLNGNIVKAEYYFDTNPGFGNGNNIALTAGPNIQNLNFSAGITNLAAGVHFLFVRSKNANGAWSVTNNLIFYKSGSSIVTNIVRLEYFIDTDPGFGNATGVSITPGTNIQNTLVNVSTLNLSEGIHFLSVRSKDASGRWSITNKFVFVKLKY